jgi:hypothetical protein
MISGKIKGGDFSLLNEMNKSRLLSTLHLQSKLMYKTVGDSCEDTWI